MEMKIDSALVRKLRLERSWSQEVLAQEAQLNLRTIQRAETTGRASLQTRRRLAAALGVTPSELEPDPGNEDQAGNLIAGSRSPFDSKGLLPVALYLAVTTLSLGFVAVDQIYAYLIEEQDLSATLAPVFSEVSDFFLQVYFLSAILAIAAICMVWQQKSSRLLFAGSGFIGIVAPILFVFVVANFFPSIWVSMDENGTGPVVRILAQTSAVVLGFLGWMQFRRPHPSG